eukprot:5332926-Ditylum_brightwellii.AAC.1
MDLADFGSQKPVPLHLKSLSLPDGALGVLATKPAAGVRVIPAGAAAGGYIVPAGEIPPVPDCPVGGGNGCPSCVVSSGATPDCSAALAARAALRRPLREFGL